MKTAADRIRWHAAKVERYFGACRAYLRDKTLPRPPATRFARLERYRKAVGL